MEKISSSVGMCSHHSGFFLSVPQKVRIIQLCCPSGGFFFLDQMMLMRIIVTIFFLLFIPFFFFFFFLFSNLALKNFIADFYHPSVLQSRLKDAVNPHYFT